MSTLSSILVNLHLFSERFALKHNIPSEYEELFHRIDSISRSKHVPAVRHDVGALLSFLCQLHRPQQIFEFGSGHGQSAFWYFVNSFFPTKVFLTEKRAELKEIFDELPWPVAWKEKMDFYVGDAFDALAAVPDHSLDLIFMDGHKARYLEFLLQLEKKITPHALIIVDNIFWRGNILDDESKIVKKMSRPSVEGLKDFLFYLDKHPQWQQTFLPYEDGVLLLQLKS